MDTSYRHAASASETPPPPEATTSTTATEADATLLIIDALEELLETRKLTAESRFIDLTSDVKKSFAFLKTFQQLFEIELPVSALFDAPTIRDLADIAVSGRIPKLTRLVRLRVGDAATPPLFLVPGLGGLLFELLAMAKALDYAGPVYGLVAPGLDGVDAPCATTAEMSAAHFRLAQQATPTGPYRFLGYSFGGVVAFEMARLAAAAGAEVDFLGALDANFQERSWPVAVWLRDMLRRARQPDPRPSPAAAATASPAQPSPPLPAQPANRLAHKIRAVLRRIGRKIAHRYLWDPSSAAYLTADPYYIANLPPTFQRARDAWIAMAGRYRPRYHDATLHLFRAELGNALSCDPLLTWRRVVRRIILRPVPGNHANMLRAPHVQALARDVSRCLAEIEAARSAPQR